MIAPVAERVGESRRRGRGFGRAALTIGALTIAARVVGFGRQVVFAHTVGTTCLGTAYTTANMVPNIIYDIVLGGALSSVVVPVLAGRVDREGGASERGPGGGSARNEREQIRQIASALLTWTVVLLLPVSALLAVAARPIVTAALSDASGCPHGSLAGVGTRMLIVFAPQVLLYGLAVVLYGILQSHRRFGAPALAPLLSSLVVIGAYAAFGEVGGGYVNRLSELPPLAEVLLSGGTTLGVLALVVTAVIPAWRLGARSRPTLRFPSGVAPRVRRLALAGVATLVAQDASVAVVIVLANHFGASGALVIYGFAWAVFVVPFAVLAVPIATSAFPELSTHDAEAGASADNRAGSSADGGDFHLTAAASTRAVMVASWLGAAVLIGAREPIARVFEPRPAAAAATLALAIAAFAPGLIGYGLSANLSRVLYARHRNRAPALAIAAGWLLVIVANAAIVPFVPASRVVPVLGLGTTFGLTVSGIALLVLVRRECGPAALSRVSRAFLAGLAGCAAGAAVGAAVSSLISTAVPALPSGEFLANIGLSVLVAVVVTGVFAAVVLRLDGGDVRSALSRLRARPPA